MSKSISFLVILLCLSFTFQAQERITAYLFLLDDCVICQSYSPKLNQLYAEYGEEVNFVGVFPNFTSKPDKIDSFKVKYGIEFETRTDYWKKMVHKWGVEVTPEVVVYDEENEQIIYKGRIDNEFVGLGKRRKVVTTDELSEVLQSITSGDPGPFTFTDAVGCFINFNDPIK